MGASWRVFARLGRVLARLWGVLGASWARLGASWRRLGASWARLGASWAILERLESVWLENTSQHKPVLIWNGKRRSFWKFAMVAFRHQQIDKKSLIHASWEHLRASCGSRRVLGAFWRVFGASWARLGRVLARLGSVVEASERVLGASWRVLGASCAP